MKKTKYVLLALFFIPIAVIGQKKDTLNLVIRTTAGYVDNVTSTEMGTIRANTMKNSIGTIEFSVGLLDSNWFEIGVGVEYQKQKAKEQGYLFVPDELYADYLSESNVNVFFGKFYIANHWRLFNRFYFSPKFTIGYGDASGKIKSTSISISELKIPDFAHIANSNGNPIIIRTENDVDYNFYAIALTPAFNFYFNKHFALTLETGAFQLSWIDNDWKNRQCLANISPVYWNLGFVFVL